MSYISFYRKWRPQAFSEVIGQEHIVKTLQNAISKNRLVHGYMFCGPKGTGKTSVARIFAKAINCINGPSVEPCNKCDNCISITAGSNVDFIEIDGASNNGVDDIRILREKVTSLPLILRKKIYIIDEVHMLSKNAFNALLKTLEEPPEHVIFMMATTHPQDVIPTILSRCQRFNFEPISVDRIKNRLKDIASIENIDITDSAISMVAKYSDGSLRDADGILEQLSSFGDNRITVDEVSSILGITDIEMLFELANIILEKNINQGLMFVSRLFSTSFSLNAFISDFMEHLYSLYIIKNYENPADILDMPDDLKENYYNQAGLFTQGQLESLIELFTGLLAQIKDSENPKTFFKAAVIKALNTKAVKSSHEIQFGRNIKNGSETKSGYVIKNDQAIKNLKTIDDGDTQSKNEPVGVNSGIISDIESKVQINISNETFDMTENVTAAEIPGQQKTAMVENTPISKPVEEASVKVVPKETIKTDTYRERTGESPDKAAAKEAPLTPPDKSAAKEAAEKKEPAKPKEEQYLPDMPFSNNSTPVAESSNAKKPGSKSAEDLTLDLKKSSGDFSHLVPGIWENVLVKIRAKSVPLQAILKEVRRFNIQGNKMFFYLEPKNRWHKGELNKLENRVLIQELLKSLTGEKFEIIFDFISDENISESINFSHPDRKIRSEGDLLPEHKGTLSFSSESTNAREGNQEVDAGGNTAVLKNSLGDKDAAAGSGTFEYFEEKFKLKEK